MSHDSAPPGTAAVDPALAKAREALPESVAIWLIDGFNVLHAGFFENQERTQWWTAAHRDRLVERIQQFPQAAEGIWIVFDGPRAPAEDGSNELCRTIADCPVHRVFSSSADDWLLRRVRADESPQRLAVVTGDRPLGNRARHRNAHVVSPRTFLAHCIAEGTDA